MSTTQAVTVSRQAASHTVVQNLMYLQTHGPSNNANYLGYIVKPIGDDNDDDTDGKNLQ